LPRLWIPASDGITRRPAAVSTESVLHSQKLNQRDRKREVARCKISRIWHGCGDRFRPILSQWLTTRVSKRLVSRGPKTAKAKGIFRRTRRPKRNGPRLYAPQVARLRSCGLILRAMRSLLPDRSTGARRMIRKAAPARRVGSALRGCFVRLSPRDGWELQSCTKEVLSR
jgi:hypothetical protein